MVFTFFHPNMIILQLEQKMSLRGSGGDLLRGAVTNYIQNISDAHFPCHGDNVVDLWKMVLGEFWSRNLRGYGLRNRVLACQAVLLGSIPPSPIGVKKLE